MPIRQTQSVTRPRSWLNELISSLKTRPAAALLATGKIRLLKDRVLTLNENTTKADLEAHEADFTDYPAGGNAFAAPDPCNYNVLGQGWVGSSSFIITTDPVVTGNDITGYWIDNGTLVLVAEYFPIGQEVPMQVPGDWLDIDCGDCLYFVQPT